MIILIQKKKERITTNQNNNNTINNKINNCQKEEEINEDIPLQKINSLIIGQKLIDLDEICDNCDEDYHSINARSAKSVGKRNINNKKKESAFIAKSYKENFKYSINSSNDSLSDNKNFNKLRSSIASIEMNEKLLTAEEIKGLNSIEKAIISLNNNNNFNETNLFPKELDRIKYNQTINNKTFFKSVLVFTLSLNTSNMINEFLLLLIQINVQIHDKIIFNDEYDITIIKKLLFLILIVKVITFIISLSFSVFIMKKINRQLLLFLIIFLILNISIILFLLINKEEYLEHYSFILILFIFASNDLINGLSSIFSDKIVPSFIKFCHFNVKYLISYISTLGSLLGGISFSIMMYFIENNRENQKIYLIIFIIIFESFSFICLICLCFSYKSLRIKALSKLREIKIE